MDKWGKLVEERLQTAFDTGAFADLPGKGKPLDLDDEPLADPAHWMARHILRNSGMSLPWVEERRRIEEALAQARARLARSRPVHSANRSNGQPSTANELRWRRFEKKAPRSTGVSGFTTYPSRTCASSAASSSRSVRSRGCGKEMPALNSQIERLHTMC